MDSVVSTRFTENPQYEQDFYAWLIHSAKLIREGRFSEADIENIAEELEGMARSDKRQLINRFAVLLAHLLKWKYQPQKRSASWKRTIKEQRKRIHLLLKDSPSLKHHIEENISDAYEIAVLSAAGETDMDESVFPEDCEYSAEEISDGNFYPD